MLLVDLLINGVVQGSLLALICIGYSLAYGSAKVINFAHADVMIAGGGYLVFLFITPSIPQIVKLYMAIFWGLATLVALFYYLEKYNNLLLKIFITISISILCSFIIFFCSGQLSFVVGFLTAIPFTAILALAVYRIGYYPLIKKDAPRTSILLIALAFSIAIQSILLIIWGSQRINFSPDLLPKFINVDPTITSDSIFENIFTFGKLYITSEITIPTLDILIIIVFSAVVFFLYLFFKYSRMADAIIATADSRITARACGIPIYKTLGYAFLLGGAIAAIGGTLFLLRSKSIYPTAGFTPGIVAFIACVLGGIGSLRGSILGAFITSLVISLAPGIPLEDWVPKILPDNWINFLPSFSLSDWSFGVVYILMILIILFKPQGIFNK